MSRSRWLVFLLFSATLAPVVWAQFGGFNDFRFRFRQNDPPPTEFIFSRWQYSSGSGWNHDYPDAEQHINQIMSEASGIHVERMSYLIVPMESEDIFKYPFGYISEPGQMWLTDQELTNFREFVNRGGFVMIDDFDGPRHFAVMKQNLERVFPDREMFLMTGDHPILHTYYDIESLYVESPYQVGGPATFYGINDQQGNLSIIICYNNDIGDFWEWIDQPRYPLRPGAEALRMGVNFVLYAMTH